MPVLSLLYSKQAMYLRTVSLKIMAVLQSFVETIVPSKESENTETTTSSKEEEEQKIDCAEAKLLFPKKHNVDTSLDFKASIVPCALDLSALQSPMSMTKTPEGHMEWQMVDPAIAQEDSRASPLSPKSNSSRSEEKDVSDDKEASKFVCHYCDAEFRIRGYLTRHIKKHAVEKAYYCPFLVKDLPPESRCHNTGGFSRRDTYKTHLRSRHFIYPKGVKTHDRAKSSGHCAHCGEEFENTDVWIQSHIETGECKGLPEGFTGLVKNSRKSGKLKMIKTSNGHSRFISTQQSVIEPNVLFNKEAIEATAIVVNEASQSTGDRGIPAITKMSDNRIMLNSENFKGAPKPKKRGKNVRRNENILKTHCMATPEDTIVRTSSSDDCVTPLEETPLDDIYLSMDPSPTEDGALEPVNSASSASSHLSAQDTYAKKQMKMLSFPLATAQVPLDDDVYNIPLDLDQSPMITVYNEPVNTSKDMRMASAMNARIIETLNKQMDPVLLSERHLRETQQYLNFYNYTFDTQL